MAGIDFNNIYVDFSGGNAVGQTDIHGAIICSNVDGYAPVGTQDNPLSFSQFRKYLQYRLDQNLSGKYRQFYIQGSYTGTVDYLGGGDATGIFNIRYNSWDPTLKESFYTGGFVEGYTVDFKSWVVDEPYKLNLSVTTSATNVISSYGAYNPSLYLFNTYDIKLYVSNMQIQANSFTDGTTTKDVGAIVIYNETPHRETDAGGGTIDDEAYNNKIALNNCMLITNGNGYTSATLYNGNKYIKNTAFAIERYTDVLVSNCLFYSSANNGVLAIRDKFPDGGGDFVKSVYYRYTIVNSIFLNIVDMYRLVDSYRSGYGDSFDVSVRNYKQMIINNVMSGSKAEYFDNDSSTTGNWARRNLIAVESYIMQYDFPIPALTWDLSSLTMEDFHYFRNGWEDITIDGIRVSSDMVVDPGFNVLENQLKNTNKTAYNNEYPYTIDTFTYGRRDGLGALYFPELPSPIITISDPIVSVGDDVYLNVTDTNYDATYQPMLYSWYKNNNSTPFHMSTDSTSASFNVSATGIIPISLIVNSHNDWYSVNDSTVVRSVIDQSSISLTLKTLNALGSDVSTFTVNDIVTFEVQISPNTNIKGIKLKINGSWVTLNVSNKTTKYTYTFIGYQDVLCQVTFVDGSTMYTSKTINIIDVVSKTYYVDLSNEYEDNIQYKLNYVVYDDFEDNVIDDEFTTTFITNYDVKTMYNERVASYATGNSNVTIIRGVLSGDFNVEWSYVRDNVSSKPRVILNMDNVDYSAKWDYIQNSITIDINGSRLQIPYGSYSTDLTCPNALHKLYCKFTSTNNIFSFMYSVDNGSTWITKVLSNNFTFTNMYVNVYSDDNSGYGYILIEADSVDNQFGDGLALVKGSELYPYTYTEMKSLVSVDGGGVFADTYKCRNFREVSSNLVCDPSKQFHIDVWNPDIYGPWMLRFSSAIGTFTGTTLSNGIICNIPSQNNSKLTLTTTYNMFITWNGSSSVVLYKYYNRYTGNDKRVDIIGSTIKADAGFVTGG